MKLLLLFILIVLSLYMYRNVLNHRANTITICLYVGTYHPIKKLDRMIEEWVRYYRYLGADAIICCDNGMDKFKKVKKYCKFLKSDPVMKSDSDSHAQFLSKCAKHCKTEWMACFDLDEFLVYDEKIQSNNSLKYFLDKYHNYDALYVKWRLIGNNGLTDYDPNKDIVKQYTNMTCEDFTHISLPVKNNFNKNRVWSGNNTTKWISKTSVLRNHVIFANTHRLRLKENVKINIKEIDWNIARLNHYYILSKNDLSLPSTACKTFISERLVNNKCVLQNSSMSLREFIQEEITKSKNCPSDTLTKIKF
jgi:hypothetical protein